MTPGFKPDSKVKWDTCVLPAVSSQWECKGPVIFQCCIAKVGLLLLKTKKKHVVLKNTHPKA